MYLVCLGRALTAEWCLVAARSREISQMPDEGVTQCDAFERRYAGSDLRRWAFHDTADPVVRYLRDRRLAMAVELLERRVGDALYDWTVLVVCGGVGGEGSYLAKRGFKEVTVSDFSERALALCRERDSRLRTRLLDAECMGAGDGEYDLVLVQDGLHHLRQPTRGLTEMLRVSRRAAVLIEPHAGVVARLFGHTWEVEEGAVNYVFRWHPLLFEQVTRSYLLKGNYTLEMIRFWDNNSVMVGIARAVGGGKLGLVTIRLMYGVLNTLIRPLGNMFIGAVIKPSMSLG
jgi:ubiquinone/menaquinone biosynthesis C-methylase UbiE